MRVKGLLLIRHRVAGRNDLFATVVAVFGDVVADMRLTRGRVGRQLFGRQRIVRTTLTAAGRGDAGFLDCHDFYSVRDLKTA